MTAASQRTFPPSDNPALGLAGEFVVSNSATALMPWRHLLHGFGVVVRHAFNSATALMPWKPSGLPPHLWCGPKLQFGHGFDAVETRPAKLRGAIVSRFNSATALMPWKPQTPVTGEDP